MIGGIVTKKNGENDSTSIICFILNGDRVNNMVCGGGGVCFIGDGERA